jgi:hypothetical protein
LQSPWGTLIALPVFMKNLLFILLCIISTPAFAQIEKTFTTSDSADIPRFINLVLNNAKNKYRFSNVNNNHENAIEAIYSGGTYKLIFEFSRIELPADSNSNMPHPVQYVFNSVTGPYKDLFPFWKKYFQPGDKMKATAKSAHGQPATIPYRNGEMIATFIKYGDNWEIENKYPQNK